MNRLTSLIFAALLSLPLAALHAAEVTDLRCEYLKDPLGIDVAKPRLSWKIVISKQRGVRQVAYQVLVASSEKLLKKDKGDLWDSGKVESDQSIHVEYKGKALESRMKCFWKVRVWIGKDEGKNLKPEKVRDMVTTFSDPAMWTMGLLKPEDFKARWITASKWFLPPGVRPRGLVVSTGGWADVDLGESFPIDSIKLYFANLKTAPKRFKILGADDMQFSHPQVLVDQSVADYEVNGTGPQVFAVNGSKFRHIRLWLTSTPAQDEAMRLQIHTGPSGPIAPVEVRQMEVMSGGRNVALMRPTREFGTQWSYGHAVFLVDGMPSANDGSECPPDACPTTTAPLMRKTFSLQKPVKRATMYVAALGMANLTINGQVVTDAVLGPPFTDYTKRVVYLTHDVTALLANGENVIGAALGNGFFSTPRRGFGERHSGHGPVRVLIQTEIEYADGSRQIIPSDETWKWTRSEIIDNDTFAAYTEDRRQAKPGWARSGYDDHGWQQVAVTNALGGKMASPMGPPICVAGELKPDRVEGSRAFFKILTAGWPRVQVNGRAGQTITIIGHAPGYNSPPLTFTLATNGPAVLEPRFMYLSGPLEIEVKGLSEPLAPDAVKLQLVHADLKMAGAFACSNPFLNQVYDALLRTHLNYNGDHPMDPMREKQGWTQDVQSMFDTAVYLTDVAGLYRKWWWDFADGQDESGHLGSVLPLVGRQVYDWNSPWWSGVAVWLPWQHYQYYGDQRVLVDAYDTMRRYVDFLGKLTASGSVRSWADYPYLSRGNTNSPEAKEGILSWMGAGDWQNPYGGKDAVSAPLLDMPAWYYYATIVSDTAALLGNNGDAKRYAAIAEEVKGRFNAKYLNRETGLYGGQTDNQTAQVLPLALNVVPGGKRELTYQRLIDAIHARKDHLGTGFVGLPFLMSTLTSQRETALANKIVNQQDYPGWKTLIHDGVLAEGWEGGGAQMPSCGGAIGMWLYQSVLGIRPDPSGPGFKKFILAPQPDPATGLTWARGSYDSVHGRIVSDWTCEKGIFTLHAVVPPNSTATIFVPAKDAAGVTESGVKIGEARAPALSNVEGVKFLRMENNAAVYAVGSGIYQFQSPLINTVK